MATTRQLEVEGEVTSISTSHTTRTSLQIIVFYNRNILQPVRACSYYPHFTTLTIPAMEQA
jgi:hypothetical protein